MPHDATDLSQRLAQCTPQDTVKGALFRSVLSELQRRVGDDPRLAALKQRFEKSAWREFSNFPVAEYLELVYQAADLLAPSSGGFAKGMESLGAAVCSAFLHSAVGKLALTMGSGKDPIALLSFGPSVYGVSANYGTRTFVRLGPNEGMLQLRRDFMTPDYHLGVIRTGTQINGHTCEVSATVLGLLDVDLHVRWQPGVGQAARSDAGASVPRAGEASTGSNRSEWLRQ